MPLLLSIVHFHSAWRAIAVVACFLGLASTATATPYLLVGGQSSNNVVRFDLDTGAASLYADFGPLFFAAPRELAMNAEGEVFVSTSEGNKTVMKLVPQAGTSVLTAVDFTPSIGEFGPGQPQFYNGDLYVAGGSTRVIRHYNGESGALVRTFSVTTSYNIRGMQIVGDQLYYAEVFQDRVRAHDLRQDPPFGGTLFQDTVRMSEPASMGTGINGHLLFTNRETGAVLEYDQNTGAFIRTIVDLSDFIPQIPFIPNLDKGIAYYPGLDQYFAATRDAVFRLDSEGNLLQTYQSDLLDGAYGLLIVPEPETLGLLLLGIACYAVMYPAVRRRKPADDASQAR